MKVLGEDERRRALQLLANYPLFEQASSETVRTVASAGTIVEAELGARILSEGSPAATVSFVPTAAVRIFHRLEDGREFTPKILAAPNHFGDVERIAGARINGQSVEVLMTVVVAQVPWSVIRDVLRSDHRACLGWLEGLASQFLYTIDADRHHVFTGLSGRVANVLLSYSDDFGQRTRRGIEVSFPLSRQQVARQVGSVRRAVLRVLQAFEARGSIHSQDAHLLIQRPEDLIAETLPRRIGLSHNVGRGGLVGEEDQAPGEPSTEG